MCCTLLITTRFLRFSNLLQCRTIFFLVVHSFGRKINSALLQTLHYFAQDKQNKQNKQNMAEEFTVNKRQRVGEVAVGVVQPNKHALLISQIIERAVVHEPVCDMYWDEEEIYGEYEGPEGEEVTYKTGARFHEVFVHDFEDDDWTSMQYGGWRRDAGHAFVSRKDFTEENEYDYSFDCSCTFEQQGSKKVLDIHTLPDRYSKSNQIDQGFVIANEVASCIAKPWSIYAFLYSFIHPEKDGACWTTACPYIDESNTVPPTARCALGLALEEPTISVGTLAYIINNMELVDDPSGRVVYRVKSPCVDDDRELFIKRVVRIR